MSNRLFLAKVKNSDERDVVKYIEFTGFECNHYFGGLHIGGACFSGFEKEFRDLIENNFEELETILTKDDFIKLFELNNELKALGYGIKKDSDKYNKGLKIIKEYENTIEKKLKSNENKELFEKVISEEKKYCMRKYDLSYDEVKEIFDNYGYGYHDLGYRDRAIIGCVFRDFDDMVYEEKFNFGYDEQPYFDDESFGYDLLESENYYKLDSGKIVSYNY